MKVKDLIALLQKEDPEAAVIKYNDGGTTATSNVEGLTQVVAKSTQDVGDRSPSPILIE